MKLGEASGRLDATSTLIAQHFSIVRELRGYCGHIKDNLKRGPGGDYNLDEIWAIFDNLVDTLESGCDFLNFPIQL